MAVNFVDFPFPPWAIPPRWVGIAALAWLFLQERYQNRLARLGFYDYDVYLTTFHWSRLRWRALLRARWRCTDCGRTRRDIVIWPDGEERRVVLVVHHNRYDLGREKLKDLTVLCEYHHGVIHAAYYAPRRPRPAVTSHTGAAGPVARVVEAGASPPLHLRSAGVPGSQGGAGAPPFFRLRRGEASRRKLGRRLRTNVPACRSLL